MSKCTLLTGGSGLLAVNWALAERDNNDLWLHLNNRKISISRVNTFSMDLLNKNELISAIDKIRPDLIVHTAALTNVDYCERYPNEAVLANVGLATSISTVSSMLSIPLIYISTDHLFSGLTEYTNEKNKPSPLNTYAKTKADGEAITLENDPYSLVLRTNFFGWGPPYRTSFSDWIIKNLRSFQPVTLYDNVFFTPVYVNELVKVALKLKSDQKRGIYNVSSSDRVSKFEFGVLLAEKFNLDLHLIKRGSYKKSSIVKRPLDMSLDNKKLLKTGLVNIFDIKNSIQKLYEEQDISNDLASIVCNV